jgi:alpha-1,2-mannosyltransferase
VEDLLPWNAHPPVAVLIALPFGRLGYEAAHETWNILMLGLFLAAVALAIFVRGTPVSIFSLLPLLTLLLFCFPVHLQIIQGQLNSLLVLLLVAAWWADTRERSWLAGAAIGAAAAVKLFPAFLLLCWLMRQDWKALGGALAALVLLNVVALAFLGADAFSTYFQVVVPSVSHYRSSWGNISLSGFWLRLFDPEDFERVIPLIRAPVLAIGLTLASQVAVAVLTGIRCRQAKTRTQRDRALALTVVGMLLAAPIVWNHYLVMLLLPLAVRQPYPPTLPARVAWCASLVVLWVPLAWFLLLPMGKEAMRIWNTQRYLLPPAQPWQSLCGLSIQTYALVVLFVLCWKTRPESRD